MESQKITSRWYDDACGTALALELVGERWSLLIVRELMFGPRRFGELRAGLPGISANILTQRLAGLERAGILRRQLLPPPASVQVYELTPWGYESEPAIQALGRWAVRSPEHDPRLPLSGASLMMSFRTMLDGARAGALDAVIGFALGAESFRAHLRDGRIAVARGEAGADAALWLAAPDAPTIAAFVYGGVPLVALEEAGVLRVAGDRTLAERLPSLFPLPEKVAPNGAAA